MIKGYTLNETIELMKKFNIKPSKGLGQNFLVDKNILGKIVDAAEIGKDDQVLEIGPGIGTMTRELADRADRVTAVEIDERLIAVLEHTVKPLKNVSVINGDILALDLKALWRECFTGDATVVANLPYYVTSPIIIKLLEEELPLRRMVIMVQKEVARRMSAGPGGKEYGALSIAVQYRSRPSIIAEVPPSVFIPPPRVSSAIVRLDVKKEKRYPVKDEKLLFQLVKAAFGQRRKTLINALDSGFKHISRDIIDECLTYCGIDPRRRGETLSIEEFCCLADYMFEKNL
jgi:16S rRNA (adenine1518-N6/adenine1519-N6)-dimethyltransferase